MSCLLGIDLGTSSVKVVVFAVEGVIKGIGLAEYPILTPRIGYAEQDPEQWWRATITAVRQALAEAGHPEIWELDSQAKCMAWYCLIRERTWCDLQLHPCTAI